MHPERWQSCAEIFNAAVEQPPNERAAFLERSCNGDEALRRKVDLLLKYHNAAGDFIKSPAFEAAPELLIDPDTLMGQHLGCYRVEAVAGIGGMGVVYLACDERLGRKVALKLLPQAMVANEAALRRLKREARTASALNHPNIVTIHEIGEVNSTHYVATEFIEGTTLRERMTKGPVPPNEALDIAAQVASALCVAHRVGIVHRDIKPENIMLRPDGYVKVLDFGIAKLTQQETLGTTPFVGTQLATQQSMFLGTTRYMSPEQAMAQQVDARSDLWSLGVVLYEMLAGRAPFEGETATDVIAAISESDPQPLKQRAPIIPRALQNVVERSLRKDPAERYQTAEGMLSDLRAIKEKTDGIATRSAREIAVAAIAALLVGLALFYAWRGGRIDVTRAPEKSVAVLPFENLSKNEENAFFADGVQDEILSNLTKVADLKVISRTSVMLYKAGNPRNLREIGQQLGVAHVLEGNVQRAGGKVRVNAQLVDTRTDKHLWGQTYDRDLADVFAIQSEIAQKISDQLEAKISPREKAAITEQPTKDLAAYDLYFRATLLIERAAYPLNAQEQAKDDLQAVDLLNQAVARDPAFLLAYCRLAEAHDDVYLDNVDRTPNRLALAKAAIDSAFRLKPDSGEAHLALATHFYHGYWDYDRARDELAMAVRTLPNNARLFEWSGLIDRRQNRWHDAVRNLERAMELDPRNVRILASAAVNYWLMRDYAQALAIVDRIIALEPKNIMYRFWRAQIEAHKHADIRPLQAVLEKVFDDPALLRTSASDCFLVALWARNPVAADRALAAITDKHFPARQTPVDFTRTYAKGLVARMKGDEDGARAAFSAARTEQEKVARTQPDDFARSVELCSLGLIDAALGRKQEALSEGRRAVELLPITKNALDGPEILYFYAVICAQVGERDLAIEQLKTLAKIPKGAYYGELRLDPFWDPLRGDRRFEEIVEEAKQPVALK